MSITPTGRPAWARTVAHTDYGGHVNKANYQSQGVVNPRTDFGAEAHARMAADEAACVRTGAFFECSFTCNDTGSAAPTILYVMMMTGVRLSPYEGDAPPAGFPGAIRVSTGRVRFTFASEYTDPYGVAEAFTPRGALVTCVGTSFADGTYDISGQNLDVLIFDASGAALGNRSVNLTVW